MKTTKDLLVSQFNTLYPDATNLGYIILLSGDLVNTDYTVVSDTLTLTDATGLGEGSRVRLTSTGTLPAGHSSGTDYWVALQGGNDIKLADSYANYLSNTYITASTSGTGTHTVIEQEFSETVFESGVIPITALIAKELSTPDYARTLVNLASPGVWDSAVKQVLAPIVCSFTKSDPAAFSFRYVFFVQGANSTIGDTTGTMDSLHDFGLSQSITGTQSFTIKLGHAN